LPRKDDGFIGAFQNTKKEQNVMRRKRVGSAGAENIEEHSVIEPGEHKN